MVGVVVPVLVGAVEGLVETLGVEVVLVLEIEVAESEGEGRVVSVVPVDAVTVGVTGTLVGTLVSPEVSVEVSVEVPVEVPALELGQGETVGRPSGQTPRGVSQIKNPKKQPSWRTIVGATIVNQPRQQSNEQLD
jgi:hypothetical protein